MKKNMITLLLVVLYLFTATSCDYSLPEATKSSKRYYRGGDEYVILDFDKGEATWISDEKETIFTANMKQSSMKKGTFDGEFIEDTVITWNDGSTTTMWYYEGRSSTLCYLSGAKTEKMSEFEENDYTYSHMLSVLKKAGDLSVAEEIFLDAEYQIVSLGKCEQDGDESNGPEEIKWIVIEENNDNCVLLSLHILDLISADSPEQFSEQLKSHLSNAYLNWFSDQERTWVVTNVDEDLGTTGDLFLLSYEKIKVDLEDITGKNLNAMATGFVRGEGLASDKSGESIGMSRWAMFYNEKIYDETPCQYKSGKIGIRPAIVVSKNKSGLSIETIESSSSAIANNRSKRYILRAISREPGWGFDLYYSTSTGQRVKTYTRHSFDFDRKILWEYSYSDFDNTCSTINLYKLTKSDDEWERLGGIISYKITKKDDSYVIAEYSLGKHQNSYGASPLSQTTLLEDYFEKQKNDHPDTWVDKAYQLFYPD